MTTYLVYFCFREQTADHGTHMSDTGFPVVSIFTQIVVWKVSCKKFWIKYVQNLLRFMTRKQYLKVLFRKKRQLRIT